MAQVKHSVKVGALVVIAIGAAFIITTVAKHYGVGISASRDVNSGIRVQLPKLAEASADYKNISPVAYPSTRLADVQNTPVPIDIWEWNAYFALLYANGGPNTTQGSLMEKNGVNLSLKRQDSNKQMKTDLLACAKELSDGAKTCTKGVAAIVVMGDSGGQWLADLNPQLKKLGPNYVVKIYGAVGRSDGEDALLGPASWKRDPQSIKGGTIVGVIMDGDWNIAMNYMAANGLKNNPDLTTYDPDAVNWIAAPDDDYIKAVTDVFNANKCETRRVVKDGKPTGEQKQVCPDGVVTWTPGDELAVHGRPETVKVISSHEYSSQMPSVIIGIKKFFDDNHDEMASLLAATFEAADQIKAFDSTRKVAGKISAEIYQDQGGNDPVTGRPATGGEYWYRYFSGVKDRATGQPLGGSAVFNLEDNLKFFGLSGSYNNNMKATYEMFGKIDTEQYPKLFQGNNVIPAYKDAVDTSLIFAAQSMLANGGIQSGKAEQVDYAAQKAAGTVRGSKPVYITFDTGSNTIKPESYAVLNGIKDQLAVDEGLAISIDGYTDNTGSDTVNIPLSRARAEAVKHYFQSAAPATFPDSRFKSVDGHGSQDPACPGNATADCKRQNRRVVITQIGE